jgi:hypothetical protein
MGRHRVLGDGLAGTTRPSYYTCRLAGIIIVRHIIDHHIIDVVGSDVYI